MSEEMFRVRLFAPAQGEEIFETFFVHIRALPLHVLCSLPLDAGVYLSLIFFRVFLLKYFARKIVEKFWCDFVQKTVKGVQ